MKISKGIIGSFIVARLDYGEDLFLSIEKIAKENQINSGFFSIIGTVTAFKVGFFNGKEYEIIERSGDCELVSCTGNITQKEDEEIVVHAHIVFADEKGECIGGHLLEGCPVSATCEVSITTLRNRIFRVKDKKTGLFLIK
ncbi:MAG: PPC domain-containing DNA-binding protein [Candidatus Ranarchaeia archaeon]